MQIKDALDSYLVEKKVSFSGQKYLTQDERHSDLLDTDITPTLTRATSKSSLRLHSSERFTQWTWAKQERRDLPSITKSALSPASSKKMSKRALVADSSNLKALEQYLLKPYNDKVDISRCLNFNDYLDSAQSNSLPHQKHWRFLANFILKEEQHNFRQTIDQIQEHNSKPKIIR